MPRVAVIVLAAGLSRRFGIGAEHKLLATLGGRPVVRHVVSAALEANVGDVVVVTGAMRAALEDALQGLPVERVYAADHRAGMAASLRTGITAARDADAAVIALGDQPDVRPDAFRRVVRRWRRDDAAIVVSHYAQEPAVLHPVLFAASTFSELAALTGDTGARAVVARDPSRVAVESMGWAAPRDIDTQADLVVARDAWGPDRES